LSVGGQELERDGSGKNARMKAALNALLDRRYSETARALASGPRAVQDLAPLSPRLRIVVGVSRSPVLDILGQPVGRAWAADGMVLRTERFLFLRAQYSRLYPGERRRLRQVYRLLVAEVEQVLREPDAEWTGALEVVTRAHLDRTLMSWRRRGTTQCF